MTKAEQAFIDSVPYETFLDACLVAWAAEGKPLTADMMLAIQEEYNNQAIENLIAGAYEAGILRDEEAAQ